MPCPICKKAVDDADRDKPHSAYPFCSERCKLMDLGRWLDGGYQIPVADDQNPADSTDNADKPD